MSSPLPKVLIVEDTSSMAQLYRAYLGKENYEVTAVGRGAEALVILHGDPPDLLVLDLHLPDMRGQDLLAEVTRQQLPTSVVVVTSDGSLKVAIEAMKAGAYDFLVKPFNADRLVTTARNALEHARLRGEVDVLKDSFVRDRFCGFIGQSLAMQNVYRSIQAAAPSTATVFITGESGTGKEVAAEAIHTLSRRSGGPFVAINCGAIPKDLIESELFGHLKGSFTGATADRLGAAEQADGGTLFLDEICEMQIDLQTKLLRFLQTGTFRPVGSSKLERVDVRVLCATNRDPMNEVQAGRFREDLFYRLHVVPLHLPPLREREEDVVLIASAFLKQYAKEESKRFQRLGNEVEAALRAYEWPGNVRQLQNVLRNAVVMNDGTVLNAAMVPMARTGSLPAVTAPPTAAAASIQPAMSVSGGPMAWRGESDIVPLARLEKAAIDRAIELCGGNIPRAAAFLGVSPSTIYRKKQSWHAEGLN